MPPRISRSSIPSSAATKKPRTKTRKRNLDAYATAYHSTPAKSALKKNRLGESMDDGPSNKRRRNTDDGDDDDESDEEALPTKRRKPTNANDDGDIEEGSDSSGNEWTFGGLAEDDEDSDIDSDEAFGESDEERFEGFAFRGSASSKGPVKRKERPTQRQSGEGGDGIDLREEASADEEGDDDFGDEGVDLATMLDGELGEDQDAEDESEDEDDASSFGFDSEQDDDDDDDAGDEERTARMRDRIDALDSAGQPSKPQPAQPSAATPLTLEDLLADLDPSERKEFASAIKTRKRSERPKTLSAPLPQRQQDRLNREVASKKAKEQLDRWRDTVIQNRRAEFLSFPLKHNDEGEPIGKDKFVDSGKPQNELEEEIRKIMQDSGMMSTTRNGEEGEDVDEEAAIIKAEDLATKDMDVEDLLRRRAELRRSRELLFREERKAKRIKKIKSRSFRRVHRRERARDADREREERRAMGLDSDNEDEKEKSDRKRAEERMSTRHKDSKWARQLKETNRTVWDEGARQGASEEARRREELRRRVVGEEVEEDEEGSNASSSDGEQYDGDEREQLGRLRRTGGEDRSEQGLSGMKFMRAAEARRRKQNDEDVERLRKEIAIEDGDEKESDCDDRIEDQGLGRAIFGPRGKEKKQSEKKVKRDELEEGDDFEGEGPNGEGEEDDDVQIVTEERRPREKRSKTFASGPLAKGSARPDPYGLSAAAQESEQTPSWLTGTSKKQSKKDQKRTRATNDATTLIDVSAAPLDDRTALEPMVEPSRPKAPSFLEMFREEAATDNESSKNDAEAGKTDRWTLVTYNDQAKESEDDEEPSNAILNAQEQKASYHGRAFAGDNVASTFQAEKADLAESEDEKETTSYLPGWGSWTGTGLTKFIKRSNARQKHNPLHKTKTSGIKPADRQDAKLENVIISEKVNKKGGRYRADLLPHQYERKEEYERALRVPVGPEWTTKEVFQRSTRPRVVVKPGLAVGAMERPLV